MIDRATVDKIMDAVNIVDVVGEFVNLRKAGGDFVLSTMTRHRRLWCLQPVRFANALPVARVAMLSTS